MPTFPIMEVDYRLKDEVDVMRKAGAFFVMIGIPWEMIEPHERQAQNNHGQTLKRLAERGGLAASEAVAVLEDREWRSMSRAKANTVLADKIRKFQNSNT